jgi:hypothetical protein
MGVSIMGSGRMMSPMATAGSKVNRGLIILVLLGRIRQRGMGNIFIRMDRNILGSG